MERVKNNAGVYNARFGFVGGRKYLFTHRDPKSGEVWAEECVDNSKFLGCWMPYEKVTWC